MESKVKSQSLTQTLNLLKYTFVIVPIVAGADKFINLLTNWKQYSPSELFEFNLIYCDAMVEKVMKTINEL